MAEVLMDIMASEKIDSLRFCKTDLKRWMEFFGVKVETSQMRRILNNVWRLPHACNADAYETYEINYSRPTHLAPIKAKGRFYTATRNDIKHLNC